MPRGKGIPCEPQAAISSGDVGQAQASDVVKCWCALHHQTHFERQRLDLLALTNQPKTPFANSYYPNLQHSPTETPQVTTFAMASEFKLSATLRGHEEDVSILSCDFLISRSS